MENHDKQKPQTLTAPASDAEHEALHAQGIPHTHVHSAAEEQPHTHSHAEGHTHVHSAAEEQPHTHSHAEGHAHVHSAAEEQPHAYSHAEGHTHDHSAAEGQPHTHSRAEGHSHVHSHEHTKNVLNRLSRAIGHLQHVRGMVEEGRDCSEVLIQLAAVQSALNNTAKVILQDHMKHCIVDAAVHGDMDVIEELCEAIDRFL